jgi:acetolactate synthase-1/2/3 large subunit
MAEIETAIRLNLPIIIVVFSDETLTQIRVKQERKGYKFVGVKFKNPDFEKLAESFGAEGYNVITQDDYQKALSNALRSEKPVIIGVNMMNAESGYYRRIFDLIRG